MFTGLSWLNVNNETLLEDLSVAAYVMVTDGSPYKVPGSSYFLISMILSHPFLECAHSGGTENNYHMNTTSKNALATFDLIADSQWINYCDGAQFYFDP